MHVRFDHQLPVNPKWEVCPVFACAGGGLGAPSGFQTFPLATTQELRNYNCHMPHVRKILGLAFASTVGNSQTGQQAAPASPTGKKAPQAFKNIQILRDLDADQLQPSMQFIAASLGVECNYCHVENAKEKDDKPAKLKARHMMQLTFELNKTSFEDKRLVTCNTCHHGALSPAASPAVLETEGERAVEPVSATPPPADQLFSKYAHAAGGRVSPLWRDSCADRDLRQKPK